MESTTRNAVKKAMVKLQEAIDILEKVKGDNDEIDEVSEQLGYKIADLEYVVNG